MKASVMLEHEEKYTIILAFDVKIERDAQEMADSMGVKIFQVCSSFLLQIRDIRVLVINLLQSVEITCIKRLRIMKKVNYFQKR